MDQGSTSTRLQGSNVVVTGGGSGIGRAAAVRLSGSGAITAIIDINGAAAYETATLLETAGGNAFPMTADVSDRRQVEDAFARLPFPEIAALVNCAGIREITAFGDLSLDQWDDIVAVNLSGTFYCCKAAYPRLRRPGASIVNVSSVAGLIGIPKRVAYSASKHGVIGLTRGLADDLGAEGIRVNAVCPGVTETPLTAGYFGNPLLVNDLKAATPLRRWASPEEIAEVIVFLASDAASFCTGSVVAVDGGYTASKGFG